MIDVRFHSFMYSRVVNFDGKVVQSYKVQTSDGSLWRVEVSASLGEWRAMKSLQHIYVPRDFLKEKLT